MSDIQTVTAPEIRRSVFLAGDASTVEARIERADFQPQGHQQAREYRSLPGFRGVPTVTINKEHQ